MMILEPSTVNLLSLVEAPFLTTAERDAAFATALFNSTVIVLTPVAVAELILYASSGFSASFTKAAVFVFSVFNKRFGYCAVAIKSNYI